MAQSNFTSLAVRVHDESENQHAYEANVCIHLNKNAALTTDVKCEADCMSNVYVPVNFIPDEVFAFLAAWDASKTSSPDGMELDTASIPTSQSVFEPTRRLNDFAPPKRFYRTFWRSMARRVVESSVRAIQT
jgi:hypothetical protein